MCQHPLQDFESRLKKYERMSRSDQSKKGDVVKGWARKLEWNFCMPDEVQKLRAYIAAHMGSLNMRLTTLGLATMGVANTKAEQAGGLLQHSLEIQAVAVNENSHKLNSLYDLFAGRVVPQLQSLTELATKVWDSNLQIMNYFSKIQKASLAIDTRHTWFQDPIKLEDAFGRIIPIPVEYGWSTMQAVIRDRFISGPGHEKVQAGEYELFITEDTSQLVTKETASILRPGASITMAMLVGMYDFEKDICPKPGCTSKDLANTATGGMVCSKCKIWFGMSTRELPRPFRWSAFEKLERERFDALTTTGKRKRLTENTIGRTQNTFKEIREDRKWFKNLRIYPSDLSTATSALEQLRQLRDILPLKRAKVDIQGDIYSSSSTNNKVSSCKARKSTMSANMASIWKSVSKIVMEELKVKPEDFQDESLLTDFGMDSLDALSIAVLLEEELFLDIDIPRFMDGLTVRQFRTITEVYSLSAEATG
ncbi:hypothetical protein F5884DRAFT_769555 [Xylogone sp. PMI_703]|nr:hypothetical protein F5884DRAFT_769555 [Xylogone sp. PMI_703]